jgi:hypothetical protein
MVLMAPRAEVVSSEGIRVETGILKRRRPPGFPWAAFTIVTK